MPVSVPLQFLGKWSKIHRKWVKMEGFRGFRGAAPTDRAETCSGVGPRGGGLAIRVWGLLWKDAVSRWADLGVILRF